MSQVLVIKGANFTANKVTTVSFIDEFPCTGVTLDKNTLSLLFDNTDELIATVTPNNTTDPVLWSTSNGNVVIVTNGVLLAVGIGTAVITATCGNYSASCTVTVTASFTSGTEIVGARISGNGVYNGGNGLGYIGSAQSWGTIANNTGVLGLYIYGGSLPDTYYPYKLPKNTGKIKVTLNGISLSSVRYGFFNSETNVSSSYPDTVKMIYYAEESISENTFEIMVQDYSGYPDIDSFVISFNKGSSFVSADFANITVEFVPIDEE